ncbi:retrovirus-related pol polyprotein from transposon TNT 1-94 [Tanacetum coccineum]
MSSIAKFDVEKFDGYNDFGLWRVKMWCLLIQHGWEDALDPFPGTMTDADKTAALKTDVYKKAHSALLLCLDNKVLREVNKEDSIVGVWLMLETFYMTKSLANKLYLKKKLFTFYMHSSKKLSEHIDEFNKLIGDLANIDIDIDDEDQALMLLTSLPSSYDNFVETLLYGREPLTLEDVNQGHGSSRLKLKGKGTYKLKCYICYSEDHLKKDCPKRNKKKSIGFVKKNAGQGSGIHSKGYDNGDLLMAEFNGGTILLGDNRACSIKGTGKVRVQMKDGSSFMLENVRGDLRQLSLHSPVNCEIKHRESMVMGDRRSKEDYVHQIDDIDRLVKNLCTIWFGRMRLHANVVRFQRTPMNKRDHPAGAKGVYKTRSEDTHKDLGQRMKTNSYAGVVKQTNIQPKLVAESEPALVLDNSYMLQRDFSMSLMGKCTGGLALSPNLPANVLAKRGKRRNFQNHTGVGSWFALLQQAYKSFHIDERVTVLYWIRAKETSGWVPEFMEEELAPNESDDEMLDEDLNIMDEELKKETKLDVHSNKEEVPESSFVHEQMHANDDEQGHNNIKTEVSKSEDPFRIYDILNKKVDNKEGEDNSSCSIPYPSGFTSLEDGEVELNKSDDKEGHVKVDKQKDSSILDDYMQLPTQLDTNSKVETEAWDKLWDKRWKVVYKILKRSLRLKECLRNKNGEGGLFCVWDPRLFKKDNVTISDYFVAIRGGLVDVSLGGYDFSWSHNSTLKMSKLDRFLISKDGVWIDDPVAVKNAFLLHFKDQFCTPLASCFQLDMEFPTILSTEQTEDLERKFTIE